MDSKPSILSLVLVPAIITLIVTVLRLVGQIQGWSPLVFGKAEGGGSNALLGISWLIFVFGLWFGFKVQRSGHGIARPGKTLLTSVIAIAVLFGGVALCSALDLVWFPDKDNPGEPRGVAWFLGLAVAATAIAFLAWPRIAWTLLAYALLARIPVIVVTWLALENGWETHYIKVGAGFPEPAEGERFAFLAMPQITFWPMLTVLMGTAMASIGAMLGRKANG